MGLKTRLIVAFLSIILIPVLVTIGIITIYASFIDQLPEEQDHRLESMFADVQSEVSIHYEHIDEPEKFFSLLAPLFTQYEIDIILKSEDDVILFQSDHFNRADYNQYWFLNLNPLQVEIETNTGDVVYADILGNVDSDPFRHFQQVIVMILFSVGIGLLILIGLIAGWTWYISRTIFIPISDIFTATEEMREGNLDHPINYSKKDEIGRFIAGFNLMRTHLKQSISKQQHDEKVRKELLASISHDLRTPLASIKGYVEGLEDGIVQNEEMRSRYVQVIKRKSNQLDRLIDDLFEFSKIELDQLSVDLQRVDSQEFFDDVLQHAQLDMNLQNTRLLLSSPIPSVWIKVDAIRMEQVITNLVDNAIQYGANEINVMINKDDTATQLIVRVQDNGSGIASEDLPHVFDQFYRGEKSRSRRHGGTGLGLSITKYIIIAHGGEIQVESEEGQGSSFTFVIPIVC